MAEPKTASTFDGANDSFVGDSVARHVPKDLASSAISSIRVVGFSLKTQENESYIAYQLEIGTSQATWQVERRFREIESLSKWLHLNFPSMTVPNLPSKASGFYGLLKSREAIATDRVPLLETFLQTISKHASVSTCWEVQQFLGVQSHIHGDTPKPEEFTEGMLYLNVVEAKNLSSTRLDFYVKTLGIAPVGQPEGENVLFQTNTGHGARDPMWYEEHALAIRDRRVPVRFQVWEPHRVRSHQLLGHIQLELLPMSPFLLYDLWLPLISADGGVASGETPSIRVMAQFAPMKIHTTSHIKLDNLRLRMEKTSYTPGEVVRGQVVLSTTQAMQDVIVGSRLIGSQLTSWSEDRTETSTDSDGNTRSTTVSDFYGGYEEIMKEHTICADKSGDKAAIGPGFFVWAFEFRLPARLPPSLDSGSGRTKYHVEAYVYHPEKKTKDLLRAQAEIRVTAPLFPAAAATAVGSADQTPTLTPVDTPQFEQLQVITGDKDIVVEAFVENPTFFLGEPRAAIIKIHNKSQKTILKDGKVSIQAAVTHRDNSGRTHYVRLEPSAMTYDGNKAAGGQFPVAPGESRELTVVFQLPLGTPPTTPPDLSPLIEINYKLHTSFSTGGMFSTNVRADLPVFVSQQHTAIEPVKVYPDEQPKTEEEVKNYGFGLPVFPSELFSVSVAAPYVTPQ